jgi:DNA-binding transcriptional MerR regulator
VARRRRTPMGGMVSEGGKEYFSHHDFLWLDSILRWREEGEGVKRDLL